MSVNVNFLLRPAYFFVFFSVSAQQNKTIEDGIGRRPLSRLSRQVLGHVPGVSSSIGIVAIFVSPP